MERSEDPRAALDVGAWGSPFSGLSSVLVYRAACRGTTSKRVHITLLHWDPEHPRIEYFRIVSIILGSIVSGLARPSSAAT